MMCLHISKEKLYLAFIVTPIVGVCKCSMFLYVTFYPLKFCNHLYVEERAGCFAKFVFLVSRDCCVALSCGAFWLSTVCDCVIS